MKHLNLLGVAICLCASLLGCSSEGENNTDTGVTTDGGTNPDVGLPALDLSETLGTGQVRAGMTVKAGDLIGGLMARGRVGDIKMYNSKIKLIIEGVRKSDGWGALGGTIADADIVRPAGETGKSLFGEYFWGFGMKVQDPEKVEIINDGRDGKPAVVRYTGPDVNMPFMAAAFSAIPSTDLNTTITVDYILPPDSDILEIKSSFMWTDAALRELDWNLQIFIMGDGLQPYMRGPGFDSEEHTGDTDLFVMAGRDVSYGFFGENETYTKFFKYEGINFYSSPAVPVRKGSTVSVSRFLTVTSGGVDPVLRIYDSFKETKGSGTVSGKVSLADGTPSVGARVHAFGDSTDISGHRNLAVADKDGKYSLQLPAGSYRLVPFMDGFPLPEGTKISVTGGSASTQDMAFPAPAVLHYSIKQKDGNPLPAKIFLKRTGGPDRPDATYGEMLWSGEYQWVVNAASGEGTVNLPPGAYTIYASHGFEYTTATGNFTMTAGQKTDYEATLEHVVDTTGFVSSDFHLHSMNSPDSDAYLDVIVASFAGLGIEVPIATDHDYISDWLPTAEALNVTKWTRPVIGSEITTYTYGHFNAWPLKQEFDKANLGGFDWCFKKSPQLFTEILASPSNPILIVNHPRTASIGGYFSAAGLDRNTATGTAVDNWSDNFTAIEIINGGGIDVAVNETLPDWYSFLNHGKRFAGTSGSDVHKITAMPGSVRNYVASSTDDPSLIDPDELADNVRAQKVLVTTGPYVSVSIALKGMGETATVASGPVQLQIKVQAPLWMDVNRLSVIANGTEAVGMSINAGTADPVNPVIRFNQAVEFTPTVDTWYVVLVEGDNSNPPVTGPRPFAFTNPIYVDRDGNGTFEALLK